MHRFTCIGLLTLAMILGQPGTAEPRGASNPASTSVTPRREIPTRVNTDQYRDFDFDAALSAVAVDTTWLGSWTFGTTGIMCDEDGWTSVDVWDQTATFFHVDDFAGLGGGSYGGLVAPQGAQAMWCGARGGAFAELCSYATLPGYGNLWEQTFTTAACLPVTGDVDLDFLASWDVETNYDYVYVEYAACTAWIELAAYTGKGSGLQSPTIPAAAHSGAVRLRFRVSSDITWSDQDGLWDSDGAMIIDSLAVHDGLGGVIPTELFEGEAVGDTVTFSGNWNASRRPGYGDFAGLFNGFDVLQEDPCQTNASCLWAFVNGSLNDYSCGQAPLQTAVPFENPRGQGIHNEIWSPVVSFSGTGSEVQLSFDIYRDLPIDNLIFYRWSVRSFVGGCAGPWRGRSSVFFAGTKDWFRSVQSIGDLIEPGATEVQVALAVRDMCFAWCGTFGTGTCHSHAPLYDNVELVRINTSGPQWSVRPVDLFQDTFASDGTLTGTARADAAVDRLPSNSPNIRPGDSVTVSVSDVVSGIAIDPYTGSGAAVYGYVSVWPRNQAGKTGAALTDDSFRWPVVDSLMHDGNTWYCIRMDSSFTDPGRSGWVEDEFCLDLHDDLFTPGDTVFFFFSAQNGAAETNYWSEFTGKTANIADVLEKPMEFTILPAGGWRNGGYTLYVDGYDGFGAQQFFDWAFEFTGLAQDGVDRYDIRAPDALAGNRPGARVVDVLQQILGCYRVIIWNTGDLETGLIGDGTGMPEKSDDAGLLATFLAQLPENGGVYLSGDNIATELSTLGGSSGALLRSYINFGVSSTSHRSSGMMTSTLVAGETGSAFDHVLGPDTVWVAGSCPQIANFDVLFPTGSALTQMSYIENGLAAAIAQKTTNTNGKDAGVMMTGFSFHKIANRDANGGGMIRWDFLRDIYGWMGFSLPVPTGVATPAPSYSLAQNYPNPFNPTTTIMFTLGEPGRVRLRIFNVAGQLVRTLVDSEYAGAIVHGVEWDGHNDAGQQVASGVYFYRLVARDFMETKKMVLLK